jgi:nucleotide-binding universal stress UspA family protein
MALVAGSVAERVVRLADCSVLVTLIEHDGAT